MPQLLALKCPACNAPLEVPDDQLRVLCQFCGSPVVVASAPRQSPAEASTRPASPPVLIPEKLDIREDFDGLTISWPWLSASLLFLVPFCIAWNAFLIGWYGMAGSMGGIMPGPMRLIFLVFPMAHVAVGLGLIYMVLVILVNRTTVRVRQGLLTVTHGPIYYPGGREIPVELIDQLYCPQPVLPGGVATSMPGNAATKYPLCVRLKSGRSIPLLPALSGNDVARAVEQLIEKRLGIQDRPVTGNSLL